MNSFILKDINISFNDIFKIINEDLNLSIHSSVIDKINSSRSYLEKKITDSDESYYGINTGFGDLQNFKIDENDLVKLQTNLLKSHACGVGDKVDSEIVKLMILLKIKSSINLLKNSSFLGFVTLFIIISLISPCKF